MTSSLRRILVVTTDPPPTSSGLGTFWAKLCIGAVGGGLAIDFLGPEPSLCSPHGPSGLPIRSGLRCLGKPPLSRATSVGRSRSSGLRRLAWSMARAPYALLERSTRRDFYLEWLCTRVRRTLSRILQEEEYDAVAVLPPPLELADAVQHAAMECGVPFIHAVGDPLGERRGDGTFEPRQAELQANLIQNAVALLISKPTFDRYYATAFEPNPAKIVFLGDIFIPLGDVDERKAAIPVSEDALLHWGQLSSWRPADELVDAICAYNQSATVVGGGRPLSLTVMGKIVDAGMRARSMAKLGPLFEERPLMPYLDARAVAATARRFVVIVSPRHRDNIPSKLIDALAFGRPILMLAHPDSAAAETVRQLGVGVVADVRSVEDILKGLSELDSRRQEIEAAYQGNVALEAWSCHRVGTQFRDELRQVMGW